MASGSFNLYSSNGKLAGKIDWRSSSNGSSANSSNVSASLYVRRTDGYTTKGTWSGEIDFAGGKASFSHSATSVGSGWVLMKSLSRTVSHNSDGSGTCWIHGECFAPSGTALAGAYVGGSATVTLDRIPRYASVSHSLHSSGLNFVRINWSTDSSCDLLQYSVNNGSWVNASGNPYMVSGLSPNVSYRIKTRVRRKDSGLFSNTSDLYVSTKDIARITGVSNFEHGNSASVVVSNPSGVGLTLTMRIGNTQILSKSVSAGTNVVGFSDGQLDSIYRLYGGNSSLTVTFVVSGGGYSSSRTCLVVLKGNQKTGRINVNGVWRRAKVWLNVNGTWRRGVVWTNVNGVWKRGI